MGFWCGRRMSQWGLYLPTLRPTASSATPSESCCRSRVSRDRTQGPRTVNKTHRAKSDDEYLFKSHGPQEAVGPPPESEDVHFMHRDSHRSPDGLPRVTAMRPSASHGDSSQDAAVPAQVAKGDIVEGILPWDWVSTPSGWMRWGHFCRGGGGHVNVELLAGLQALLANVGNSHEKGPSRHNEKGKKGKGEYTATATSPSTSGGAVARNGKGQGDCINNEGELLAALEGIIKAAKKDPLLSALQGVVRRAVAGYGQGRSARRQRAKMRAQIEEETSHQASGRKPVAPDFCRPVAGEDEAGAAWTVVASGKKKADAPVQSWMIDPRVGGLIGFGVAKKRLSDGAELGAHLVVACEQSELDALVTLARAHDLKEKASVICKFSPEGAASSLQLPSIGPKGQRQVRTWPVVHLCAGGPTMQQKVVLKSDFRAPDRQLSTLRLQVPKEFQEPASWKKHLSTAQ